MCCVTHVNEPSALIEKRRGLPLCSWLWLLFAPYLVNHNKVLTNWVSKFITAITYLSERLYILGALSTFFGRYVRYIRLRSLLLLFNKQV